MALSDNPSPKDVALNTDLYELTMAEAYFNAGMVDTEAVFTAFFRDYPFASAYCISAGVGQIPELIRDFRFSESALSYLRELKAPQGGKLFSEPFLAYLESFSPQVDIWAVPEGELVFSREPIFRVEGPIIACQLLETALLNLVNFQTLIATKTSRVVHAAEGRPVSDFGLRRAQGPDGGLAVARASWIGGVSSTSNVLAGKLYNIPVFGTHAHSWVMSFPTQLEAFRAFAKSSPNNCVLLLDTYSVQSGLKDAITVASEMREQGHELFGVRIDSGDLAALSKYVRNTLDKAGFGEVKIAVSNDLDEFTIQSLLLQNAPIDSFGVGTKLATAEPNPALGGVYKLSAIKRDGALVPVMKVSELSAKRTIPGRQDIVRFVDSTNTFAGDIVYEPGTVEVSALGRAIDVEDSFCAYDFSGMERKTILQQIVAHGVDTKKSATLNEARLRAQMSMEQLDEASKRFLNPQTYPVGLEPHLAHMRDKLLSERQ